MPHAADIKEALRKEIEQRNCATVAEVVDAVSKKLGVPRATTAYELMMMYKTGAVEIEETTRAPYLLSLEGAWYWTALALTLAALAAALFVDTGPLIYARYALGALLVLFLPGYALTEALYPRGDELTPLERLALSLGLSLAIAPLVGVLLNYSPWGIRLIPVAISLAAVTVALLTTAAARKAKIHAARKNRC